MGRRSPVHSQRRNRPPPQIQSIRGLHSDGHQHRSVTILQSTRSKHSQARETDGQGRGRPKQIENLWPWRCLSRGPSARGLLSTAAIDPLLHWVLGRREPPPVVERLDDLAVLGDLHSGPEKGSRAPQLPSKGETNWASTNSPSGTPAPCRPCACPSYFRGHRFDFGGCGGRWCSPSPWGSRRCAGSGRWTGLFEVASSRS